MRPTMAVGMSALVILACSAGGGSESAVATAISQTEGARALEALALTATAAAEATDTPLPTATMTLTPTSTSTPAPTLTPTPPPGMAYVPNLVGMALSEAEDLLAEELPGGNHWRYFWVATINLDVPEWQVIEQSPDPGTLITLREDRIRMYVAVHEYTPTPRPAPRAGAPSGDPCGGVTYQGYCDGNVLVWCENGQLWIYDCGNCGGICGYQDPVIGCVCYCP